MKACPICGREAVSPHHIKPRASGGTDDAKNIVWLCVPHHDLVEQIYNETGVGWSLSLCYSIRQQLGLCGRAPGAKDSRTIRLLHRTASSLPWADELRRKLALSIRRRDYVELGEEVAGRKIKCGRCGNAFFSRDNRYTMCLSCRRHTAGCLGILSIKIMGIMSDTMLNSGNYKLDGIALSPSDGNGHVVLRDLASEDRGFVTSRNCYIRVRETC